MKILTLNTWQECGPWRDRWEIIFKGIQQMKPDIVGFQEVFNPDWAKEIQKRSGYSAFAANKNGGLLTLSRFPVVRSESLLLTKSPTEDYSRYVLMAELKTEKGPLAVFNTHWSWKLMESPVRVKQSAEFLQFTGTPSKCAGLPCAAMGDFNSTAWTPEIRQIKEAGWSDAWGSLYPEAPGLTWSNGNPYAFGANHPMPDRRIDYIFTYQTSNVLGTLQSVEVVFDQPDSEGRYASDHYGVLATFV